VEAWVAHVGRIRARVEAGELEGASMLLDSTPPDPVGATEWIALEVGRSAAGVGDTATVEAVLDRIRAAPEVRARGWELRARAHDEAGDLAGAEAAYRAALSGVEAGGERARIHHWLAERRLEAGDTAAAVEAWRSALSSGPLTRWGAGAALALLRVDALEADQALEASRSLAAGDDPSEALRALALHEAPEPWPAELRFERARLLARAGRRGDAVDVYRALSDGGGPADRRLGARILETWADLRRSQGRTGDVALLREWLLERYPESPEAVDVVFFRGDAAHDRGDLAEAARAYDLIQTMNPELNRAGLARMRRAQIHLERGERPEALQTFLGYLADFPSGRRWEEATYWAARLHLRAGREAEADRLLEGLSRRAPLSYYTVLGAGLRGREYGVEWAPEAAAAAPAPPAWMQGGLAALDLFAAAGMEEARAVTLAAMDDRARGEGPASILALGAALVDRGETLTAIRLGWEARDQGMAWTPELLRLVYPLPHEAMVVRAARERGLDPGLVAALIRQESAFDADIVSSAGAVGLMQVMPPTGRELARRIGPSDFSTESLEVPEINLHLGTRFLRDMWDRYDGRLTLVLSAYNAGPTRATRWRRFPEAGDAERFVERIPFAETRGYVKLVLRNMALYRALHGPWDPVRSSPGSGW
jgi:soluble lytic murein transglycosylase